MPRTDDSRAGDAGQAAVETIAILPLLAVLAALAWQAVVAGQAIWLAGSAARAAARAHALGDDPEHAARRALPPHLRRAVTARPEDDAVRVHVAVPLVVAGSRLGTATARARLRRQG